MVPSPPTTRRDRAEGKKEVTQAALGLVPSQTNASDQSMKRTLLQKEPMHSTTERGTDKDQEQDVPFLTRHRVITEGYTRPSGRDKDKTTLSNEAKQKNAPRLPDKSPKH